MLAPEYQKLSNLYNETKDWAIKKHQAKKKAVKATIDEINVHNQLVTNKKQNSSITESQLVHLGKALELYHSFDFGFRIPQAKMRLSRNTCNNSCYCPFSKLKSTNWQTLFAIDKLMQESIKLCSFHQTGSSTDLMNHLQSTICFKDYGHIFLHKYLTFLYGDFHTSSKGCKYSMSTVKVSTNPLNQIGVGARKSKDAPFHVGYPPIANLMKMNKIVLNSKNETKDVVMKDVSADRQLQKLNNNTTDARTRKKRDIPMGMSRFLQTTENATTKSPEPCKKSSISTITQHQNFNHPPRKSFDVRNNYRHSRGHFNNGYDHYNNIH
jgi:hypothetical protein